MRDCEWIKNGYFAHRGLHTRDLSIPENTRTAYQLAVNEGYGIELDINHLKDGTIVCFHDEDFKRLCGIDKRLQDETYEEIKDYHILNTQETIPTLQEVLQIVNRKVPLLIELKPYGNFDLLCENFMKIMDEYQGTWAMHSFHPKILIWFKKNRPEVIRGQITEYFIDNHDMSKMEKFLMKRMALNFLTKPDFINYGMRDLPNRFVNRAKRKGIVIIGYSSTNQEEFDWMKKHYHNSVFEYFKPKKQDN